jgi:hypothetical protein
VTSVVDVTYCFQYQKIQRYSESWKQTLRDCDPDLDSLPGLRRVTLNHNTDIGDDGAVHLLNVVRDDIFLKGERWSSRQLTICHVTATCELMPQHCDVMQVVGFEVLMAVSSSGGLMGYDTV